MFMNFNYFRWIFRPRSRWWWAKVSLCYSVLICWSWHTRRLLITRMIMIRP